MVIGRRTSKGFTLVEIMIVISILGILAALVVPSFSDAQTESAAAALQTNVKTVRRQIQLQYFLTGSFPASIDSTWFVGNVIPEHPENNIGLPTVQILAHATAEHPGSKVLKAGVLGAYWYNPTLGSFNSRAADKGSESATLDFYNRINDSTETTLGNYGGSGGS